MNGHNYGYIVQVYSSTIDESLRALDTHGLCSTLNTALLDNMCGVSPARHRLATLTSDTQAPSAPEPQPWTPRPQRLRRPPRARPRTPCAHIDRRRSSSAAAAQRSSSAALRGTVTSSRALIPPPRQNTTHPIPPHMFSLAYLSTTADNGTRPPPHAGGGGAGWLARHATGWLARHATISSTGRSAGAPDGAIAEGKVVLARLLRASLHFPALWRPQTRPSSGAALGVHTVHLQLLARSA